MALPSQVERSNESSRPVMSRGSGPSPVKAGLAVLGVLLAAGAIYGITQLSPARPASNQTADATGGPSSAPAADAAPTPMLPAVAAGPTEPVTIAPLPEQAPVVVSMQPGASPMVASPIPGATSPIAAPDPTRVPAPVPQADQPGRPAPVDVSTPDLRPVPAPPLVALPAGAPVAAAAVVAPAGISAATQALIDAGDRANANNRPVEARASWSRALLAADTPAAVRSSLRDRLALLNQDLVFSPVVTPGDPLVESYRVQPGDSLVRIARRRELATDWRLIQRINRITNPNALRVGQTLKLVRGPFHAVVHKSDYRLDLFTGSPDDPDSWQYIRSFRVGLGAGNSTPVGHFVIRRNSKLINPPWVNPRTGERFAADDPKNPIGEHWLGFQGIGQSAALTGYGLHGTIEPDSIGQQRSMGCVRLADEDIAMLFELLVEEISVVRIVP